MLNTGIGCLESCLSVFERCLDNALIHILELLGSPEVLWQLDSIIIVVQLEVTYSVLFSKGCVRGLEYPLLTCWPFKTGGLVFLLKEESGCSLDAWPPNIPQFILKYFHVCSNSTSTSPHEETIQKATSGSSKPLNAPAATCGRGWPGAEVASRCHRSLGVLWERAALEPVGHRAGEQLRPGPTWRSWGDPPRARRHLTTTPDPTVVARPAPGSSGEGMRAGGGA